MTPRSCIVEWGYDTQEIRTPGVGGQSCTIGGIPAHLYLAKHVSPLYRACMLYIFQKYPSSWKTATVEGCLLLNEQCIWAEMPLPSKLWQESRAHWYRVQIALPSPFSHRVMQNFEQTLNQLKHSHTLFLDRLALPQLDTVAQRVLTSQILA